MAESSESTQAALATLQARLVAVARTLRQPGSLDPQAKEALADLVDGLSKAISSGEVAGPGVVELAHDTAQLAESLHQGIDTGLIASTRKRLTDAVAEADAHHPILTGLVHQLADALANIGI